MKHHYLLTSAFSAALALSFASKASAHHGQDFLLLQDAVSPAPLHANVFSTFEWSRHDGDDEFALESGIQLGVLSQLSVGTTLEFSDEGDGWDYSSVMPYLHLQLTPKDAKWPFRAALMGGYQFANHNGEAGHSHEHAEAEEHHETEDAGGHHEEAEEHHEEEEEEGHEHGGIHRHDENYFMARLVLEADLTEQDKLLVNIISLIPEEGSPAWGYGVGVRHSFNAAWAVGLEAQGDFGDANEHELVLGGYFSPVHSITFKLGVGHGLTDESPDLTVRGGFVWRF